MTQDNVTLAEIVIDSESPKDAVHPDSIDVSELGDMLHSLGRSLKTAAATSAADLPKDFRIPLIGIRDNCIALDLQCPSNLERLAITFLAQVIQSGKFSELNTACRNHLEKFRGFLARHKSKAKFSLTVDGNKRELATLSYDAKIIETLTYKTKTNIYGQMTLSGGTQNPKIHLNIPSMHKTIACDASIPVIKELEEKQSIYHSIGLFGTAERRKDTHELVGFTVLKVLPYSPRPVSEAMKELRSLMDGVFDKVDADEFVSKVRGADE